MTSPHLAPDGVGGLLWGPLDEGVLLRRYKRFLADVAMPDGGVVTAHTPNTGAMIGCSEPGRRVWLSRHDKPSRKYRYTLEMIEMPSALVGIDTGVPNRLVKAALLAGALPGFPHPCAVASEVRRGNSRLDLKVSGGGGPDAYIEIKNCTLVEDGVASFPDAVTTRGARHMDELADIARSGGRAVVFILAQRADARRFRPAWHIDPEWGAAVGRAVRAGVELLCHRAELDMSGIRLGPRLPAELGRDSGADAKSERRTR